MYIESFEQLPVPTNIYEEKVISFCQAWMAGQDTFRIYTSGSTGLPKQLLLTRQQMIASAMITGSTFRLTARDHAFICLNIDYIAGMMMLVRAMVLDLRATIVEPKANPFADLLIQEDVHFASFVPLQLQTLLLNARIIKELNKMKVILVGGAAVSNTLAEQIKQRLQVPVYSTYGMTETVSHIAVRLINQNGNEGVFEVLGETKIGIDNRQCLNVSSIVTNFEVIQTNDIVMIDSQHSFRLLGRYDNIINSGGVKVQLEKVEKVFAETLPFYCSRSFAYGVQDERLGQRLIMVLEQDRLPSDDFISLGKDQTELVLLQERMKKVLSKYEIPKEFYAVSRFSETSSGKIDKIATIKRLNL